MFLNLLRIGRIKIFLVVFDETNKIYFLGSRVPQLIKIKLNPYDETWYSVWKKLLRKCFPDLFILRPPKSE